MTPIFIALLVNFFVDEVLPKYKEKYMKEILMISNMYPSIEKPYAGIYVKNLYEKLKCDNALGTVSLLAMERRFTGKLGSIIKYFRFITTTIPSLFKRYDIVHLHFIYPLIIWAFLYKLFHPKSKVVVTCHGSDVNKHFTGYFSRLFFSYLATKIDVVVTVGSELAKAVKIKLGKEVSYVIPAGIDERVFYNVEQLKCEYDLIFVGSFLKLKGLPELVEALLQIDKKLRICFVGSGPLESIIRSLNNKHEVEIKHNLNQQQLREMYCRAKFLVLPSKSEAFGLVVSEAMFCGTPVIASRIGGIQEQLEEGVNGFYIETVEPNSIVSSINKALKVDKSTYSKLCLNALSSNRQFSLDQVCQQYRELYLAQMEHS
ncbi:MAG: hypothetical protein COB45_01740 [Gammaproteobacteria bacterium]|nr:MAG: hypothetical protein COB45_01740 [Gammaproteobacteria bacterium]